MSRPRTTVAALLFVAASAGACGGSHTPAVSSGAPSLPSTSLRTVATAPSTSPARITSTPRTPSTIAPPLEGGRPPYHSTGMTLHLADTSRPTVSHGRLISRTRTLTTLLWMPDGTGRWPLVVFAHGFEVGPTPYIPLLEAWADHGYVVAAPEFPLTDAAVAGSNLDEADLQNQPADMRFVTDYLVSARSPVAARIDPHEVAVAGHSDGAETALAAGTVPAPPGEPVYRAIIAFGVQPVPGAAGRNPPILVGQGDEDQINPPAYGYSTFEEAASPKYLLVMRGGGHLSPLEAGSRWLPGIEVATEMFLDAYVAGDTRAADLRSVIVGDPYLSLESG